ncbi:uroporphyrinogen-III synthase [Bacillus manliponensis]|uniref:uroporphyrinogen-III synthase n=1 Tax=Bacillus manliponensis TaxID=574376 RepID=UPI0035126A4B
MPGLNGKTVLVTRAAHQAKEMSKVVRERGGIPLEIPLLHIANVSYDCFSSIRTTLSSYDWIIFTSKNGVAYFLDGLQMDLPSSIKIAAVGVKTKQELERRGYIVQFMPTAFVAEVFAKQFTKQLAGSEHILFPKGNLGREVIPVALRKRGISLKEITVYETNIHTENKQALIDVLQSRVVDVVTFTSPSTVRSFVTILEGTKWRDWMKGCTIACIGPVTEKEARKYFEYIVMPEEYTIEAMLTAVSEYCQKK